MKKFFYILFISILFISCENVDVVEVEIEYQEKIVVVAELKADHLFQGVRFTKTLPINEEYSIAKAELKEVKAYIKQNGFKTIPLHYKGEGIYNSIYNIRFQAGDFYELFAVHNGKSIYSQTVIPEKPSVQNVRILNDNFLEASIASRVKEVYGALWIIQAGTTEFKANDFYTIYQNRVTPQRNDIILRTKEIPEEYKNFRTSTFIQVIAFDESYREYYQTRNNNQPIDDTFSQVGAPVKWNVYGDDVVGIFMGIAESDLVRAN